MKKELREKVYAKYDGHCAYCGKKIAYSEMQVDHFIPQRNAVLSKDERVKNGVDDFNNLMPACRRCNHYKRAHNIETFRQMIYEIPIKLNRDNYIFKVGVDYGFFSSETHPIVFYFENKLAQSINKISDGPIDPNDKLQARTNLKSFSFSPEEITLIIDATAVSTNKLDYYTRAKFIILLTLFDINSTSPYSWLDYKISKEEHKSMLDCVTGSQLVTNFSLISKIYNWLNWLYISSK